MANIKPTIYHIDDESGYLYKPTYYPLFTINELLELQTSIIKTLKMYSDEKFDDDKISLLNDEACKNAMKQSNDDCKNISKSSKEKKVRKTFIYIMIDHNTGYYKIGHSKNAIRRERTLQSEKPTIELIYTFEADIKDERNLHEYFKDSRIRGEWFSLNQDDIKFIVSYFDELDKDRKRREQV